MSQGTRARTDFEDQMQAAKTSVMSYADDERGIVFLCPDDSHTLSALEDQLGLLKPWDLYISKSITKMEA